MPGRRWTVVAWVTLLSGLVLLVLLVATGLFGPSSANAALFYWWFGWTLAAGVVGLVTLGVRWWRADRLRRRQMLPAVVSASVLLTLLLVTWAFPSVDPVASDVVVFTVWVVLTLVPTAIAVVRHRLFGIEVRPRRVVLFVAGVGSLALCFAAVCTVLLWSVTVVGVGSGLGWIVATLGAIAAIVGAATATFWATGQLRRRLLGDRDAALPLLASVGGASHDTPASLTSVIAAALRSPDVTLRTLAPDEDAVLGDRARVEPDGGVTVPLLLQGERLGRLSVGPRSPGERYSAADQRLIALLAHQTAVHLYLERREDEVAAAREAQLRAITAERARIGRDLHDGLAPLLAGASLSAEALRRGMAPGSPDERDAALLAGRLRAAAGETRRISHDLQPAALDDGLVAALRRHVDGVADPGGPTITMTADVPALAAEVSASAYLIVLEGLSNALRHARARHIRVDLASGPTALMVTVADDGVGLDQPYVSGLGVRSMRQRVAGLGGVLALERGDAGGTVLTARIPLP